MSEITSQLSTALGDRYRIESRLGEGGMATVYLAADLKHKRHVALKVLKPELAAVLGTDRFIREIEITAGLTHPHILPVLDSGEVGGSCFYVMPFVDGESLRDRIDREGPLPIDDALSIAEEVAEALASAHNQGVVHRDIKPDNILLKEGRVYVADFGIARAVRSAGGERLTATGMAVGTPAYMSPEQASGAADIDHRTDVFSLGAVVYEMLAGEPPHTGATAQAVIAKVLADPPTALSMIRETVAPHVEAAVHRALAKTPADRFGTMQAFVAALKTPTSPAGTRTVSLRPVHLTVSVAVVAAIAAAVWLTRDDEGATVDGLRAALAAQDFEGAYVLASTMDADQIADSLWSAFTTPVTIVSAPGGATVERRAYGDADVERWEHMGTTPVHVERFPNAPSVLRLRAEGRRTAEVVFTPDRADTIALEPMTSVAEGWRHIPGDLPRYVGGPEFAFRYLAPNLSLAPMIRLSDFQMAQFEVTNADYQRFVDAAGYEQRSYWKHEFQRDGRAISWEDAMRSFTDSTGRPGPSTWAFGSYHDGEADHPVSGVSWYEAAAYAEFAGHDLPTVYHWFRAATTWLSGLMIPHSNMNADGPEPVGRNAGMSQFGVYDMAGNVREWTYNASGGERFILGGGWSDDSYVFTVANAAPPFDRSPSNGFRLARYSPDAGELVATRVPIDRQVRDFTRETPVSDDVFEVYRRLYAYDRTALNAESRGADTTDLWVREYVTFDAAYGNERVGLYVFTPRNTPGPHQTVVFFPGSSSLWQTSFESYPTDHIEIVVRGGRAFAFPIYQSTFDREDGFVYRRQDETNTYRDHVIHWANDLGRTIDYLETRDDIDAQQLAYMGFSWGGMVAPIMLATEPRLKVAVLVAPGLSALPTQPEVDAFNFVGRTSQPVLMLSGEYDMVHPLETSARPMFELWNAPADAKRHVVFDGGHTVPYYMMAQEVLDWLDRFLGTR